jgi:pullulanase/glycogen debranching enzyme
MKTKIFKQAFFLLFIFIGTFFAQVVSTEPVFPTQTDDLTIYFHADKGNQGLKDFTGDVYAHTGVITNLSTSSSDWKHVIGTWGNNSTQPKLAYLGNNTFKLVIGNARTFYKVTSESEQIQKLAFVFRNSDGSKTGRDVGGADIFVQMYTGNLSVAIASPAEEFQFAELNQNINILAISNNAVSLELYKNEQLVSSTTNDSLSYNLTITETGKTFIIAVAKDGIGNQVADSIYFVTRGNPVVEDLPANVKPGINIIDNTTVVLALYAPNKTFAYLLGDFNNWLVDPNYEMKKTTDGKTFWITLQNLTPQTEYAFQYLVDGKIKVGDPYCEKVLDPWNDGYIANSVYPNLKKYPVGKTTGIVSVFQTGEEKYTWQNQTFQRPLKEKLVIYELLMRDFVSTHSYQTLIDTLDYFVKLGINAIELMPIMEFDGNESWGYNPAYMMAPDKYYGTKNKLKEFIDKAHSKGIAVILDIVLNHQMGSSPLAILYWDDANNRPAANNPWLNPTARHPYNVGNDMNHESTDTKYFVDRVLKHWVEEYKIDGYRFDLSKGFTQVPSINDVGFWGQYDQSRINIWKRISDQIRAVDPNIFLILEHFADNSEETVLANYGFLIWGKMTDPYNEATMGWHDGGKSNLTGISYKSRGWNVQNLVGYAESHDEERLMVKNLKYGNASGTYNIKNLNTALDRIKLASAFFFTFPGPKMLWQFGELGYDVSIEYNGRTGNKPILWNYYQDSTRHSLFTTMSELIKLKKEYPVFSTNDFATYLFPEIKKYTLNSSDMNAVVVGNFNVVYGEISAGFQHSGKWYEYFSQDSISVTDVNMNVALNAGDYKIFTDKKIIRPGFITDVEENKITLKDFVLYQNYPNPFNPSTVISYQLPVTSNITLKVYDILGREITTLVNEQKPAGKYELKFDGSELASGVYFFSLKTGNYAETKKMLLMK